jgi:hypothetical protein
MADPFDRSDRTAICADGGMARTLDLYAAAR